ncbi:hypothetical protein CQR49_0313 [Bifidobacterium pseudolongum subsp. pseudolongum]|nr:hypothetical protein CQR49_0313 [Bifidobacterium pseudolongum subsp. pseudolongum]
MDDSLEHEFDMQRPNFSRFPDAGTLEELQVRAKLRSADALIRIAEALEVLAVAPRE